MTIYVEKSLKTLYGAKIQNFFYPRKENFFDLPFLQKCGKRMFPIQKNISEEIAKKSMNFCFIPVMNPDSQTIRIPEIISIICISASKL